MSRPTKAFSLADRAAQEAQRPVLKGDALLGRGVVAWKQNRLEEARQAFETCCRIFHEYRVPYREANALNNLGLIYHTREQAEQALTYYRQALALAEKSGSVYDTLYHHPQHRRDPLHVRAICRIGREPIASCCRWRRTWDTGRMLSMAYCGLADIALARDDLHAALQHASSAAVGRGDRQHIEQLGMAYRILGEIWLRREDYEQARSFFEQSLPLLEQHHLEDDLAKARAGYENWRGRCHQPDTPVISKSDHNIRQITSGLSVLSLSTVPFPHNMSCH